MAENPTSCRIPVVDFRAFSIAHEEVPAVTDPAVQHLVRDLYSACSTFGFVYLTNHGVAQDEIDNALQTTANFFVLKPEVKAKYKKLNPKHQYGWDEFQSQKVGSTSARPSDLKESFDMSKAGFDEFKFPDDVLPDLKPTLQSFYNRLKQLSFRVLTALAFGLDVNPEIFLSAHKELRNPTMLRFNYYPALTNDINIKPGQIRCVEHSDFGSITLLFQDDVGGLEVATQDGTFIPVTPIPGTVLVNIANLMQRWTSDRLKSVVHRVIIPEEQSKKEKSRQSIAYFVIPSDETIISCLDGSNKYPPVNAWEYVADLIEKSYKY